MMDKGKTKRKRFRLAEVTGNVLTPALRRRGFAAGDIVAAWQEIVGERLAASTLPEKLVWPRRTAEEEPGAHGEPATLILRVDGPAAIEIQHLSTQLLERVNVYFGYRAVGRLKIVQAPLPRNREGPAEPPACPEPAAEEVDRMVGTVPHEGLRDALSRLGRSIAAEAATVKKA